MSAVLVIGGGGREHALAWGLARSPQVERVWVAPGNGGTHEGKLRSVDLAVDATEALVQFALAEAVRLVVVGPEGPLAAGLADTLRAAGIACFGPSAGAARLEASKAFSKAFMQRHGLPTAPFGTFTAADAAHNWLDAADFPVVVKASGLAAGKGVVVPQHRAEAHETIDLFLSGHLGEASREIILEARMEGPEASILAFCDGERFALMPPAQDHKRVFDNDQGPNTGGMGAFAPSPAVTADVRTAAHALIARTLAGLAEEGTPFTGCLYAGLMLTADGPQLLEYNCRFGDPETQVLMPLLASDLLTVLEDCALGRLDPHTVAWHPGAAATVVAAAEGYPGAYKKGMRIEGLEAAAALPDVHVFHAGTQRVQGALQSQGGRVLAVTGLGVDLRAAVERAYAGLDLIHFPGLHARRDIGRGVLKPWE